MSTIRKLFFLFFFFFLLLFKFSKTKSPLYGTPATAASWPSTMMLQAENAQFVDVAFMFPVRTSLFSRVTEKPPAKLFVKCANLL